jgi:hypothetical protein
MLIKKKQARQTMCAQGTLTAAAASTVAVHEPGLDWVPLWTAPFYSNSKGYIPHANEKWADALLADVESSISEMGKVADIERDIKARDHKCLDQMNYVPMPKWSIKKCEEHEYGLFAVFIDTTNISMRIIPGLIEVRGYAGWEISGSSNEVLQDPEWEDATADEPEDAGWEISGSSNGILQDPEWDNVTGNDRPAAQWHKRLLEKLFGTWYLLFRLALRCDRAYIMARKNSILAPFERITWHQWQFFKLEEDMPALPQAFWFDPREELRSPRQQGSNTAIGPANERLYDIYIAPGEASSDSTDGEDASEEKCRRWILKMLRDYPDRSPKPLPLLAKDAISTFPGLTERAFQRCYLAARTQTGNRSWSRPGRPQKNPQKSPRKE